MTARTAVDVAAREIAKGDRLVGGWVVKNTRTKGSRTVIFVGKSGYRGQHCLTRSADTTVAVLRPNGPGSYIRDERRNRQTGTTVQVLDLTHPDSEFEPEVTPLAYDDHGRVTRSETNRWATVCIDHATLCTHPTSAVATSHAAAPTGWCPACRGDEE